MTSTSPRRPPTAVRWGASVVAALLLAPWVGAAVAFALTYVLVVAPMALPFLLVSGRKSAGDAEHPRRAERMAAWGFAPRHAPAH